MKGLTAGIIAGLAGAFAWALIAYFTGYEIGYLAWGIGALVGAAVAWGAEGTPTNGVIAVAISIVAILSGKFMAVQFSISNDIDTVTEIVEQQMSNDEYIIACMAGEAIEEQGKNDQIATGTDFDDDDLKANYPPEIWQEAETRWNAMTDYQQDELREEIRQKFLAGVQEYSNIASKKGFLASFGLFDAIFFFLAIGTAYKVAAKTDG